MTLWINGIFGNFLLFFKKGIFVENNMYGNVYIQVILGCMFVLSVLECVKNIAFLSQSGNLEISIVYHELCLRWLKSGREANGKFPQTTMWIGWVEINFTNPTVKVWANLDNPLKRTDYAKFCMSPSPDGTLPEYVISQENNSPLTLYTDFSQF